MMEYLQNTVEWILPFLGWGLVGLAILIGLALDMVGLFGNWVILVAMGGVWGCTGFERIGLWGMGGMLLLAVMGEILETALAGYGAKKFGGSKGSMVGALVGCLVGAVLGTPLFPIIGTLIGACAGAFLGAALYEHLKHEKAAGEAMWTGLGAALGKVGGLFAKLFCGLAMLLVAVLTY